jgi:hypothetical protein
MGPAGVRARAVPPSAGAVAVARLLALVPDLLFGSRLQGALGAAGLPLELLPDQQRLRAALAERGNAQRSLLIVDLTDAALDGAGIVTALRGEGLLAGTRTLGFYSHVDAEARELAERAGFDLVVPRSRMAREAPELIERVLGDGEPRNDAAGAS